MVQVRIRALDLYTVLDKIPAAPAQVFFQHVVNDVMQGTSTRDCCSYGGTSLGNWAEGK
jgi:hypothetical protein